MNTEQLIATAKSNVETLIALGTKAFEGVEKLVELNVQATKVSLAETGEAATAALSIRSVDQFAALQSSMVQPAGEKLASYSRHVYDIVSQTNAELTRIVEAAFAESQRQIVSVVDAVAQKAPVGAGNALTFAKSSIAAATSAYESVNKAAKQATGIAEANILALTDTVKAARAPKIIAAA